MWIVLTWVSVVLAAAVLTGLCYCFYRWVFRPLDILIVDSKRVAEGDFHHQITLPSQDEMADLAQAMNGMTARFQEIREDLDTKVRQRTKEVLRSEQLASVGFLAAGVAHEINNPLASIALCAESLEDRLHDIIQVDDALPDGEHNEEILIVRNYLRMIQDEAFRCKAITERLLDFSRLGDMKTQPTDLSELIDGVISMVRHIGRYKEKRIKYYGSSAVIADVNQQEMKQVVLNLLTNALDSLSPGGTVEIELCAKHGEAMIVVRDNGCGMTADVLEHLFEPFFTRGKEGQGTGLGLPICHRIIDGHGGRITAESEGPGKGSRLTVIVPLERLTTKENRHHYQAA
jgi:signal transduction histidine kinase